MKILHTADWHIGKKLHQFELQEDFILFIDWLVQLILDQKVDVLLVSGDIFDMANPSSEARKQYYEALIKLQKTHCKIIITGGNHDSPNMLNAPRDILNLLDIHVLGGLSDSIADHIIPIEIDGQTKIVVAAIPFLRDADLRKANEGENYEDRLKIVQKGIEHTYKTAVDYCVTHYNDIPIIAMGHLYTAGVSTSDSEREIQMGNQAVFYASRFGQEFDYVALGHIHKPQQVSGDTPIFYSGSPYPLSFSERDDQKRVLLINTHEGFEPLSIPIPVSRRLIRIKGHLNTIQDKLNSLNKAHTLTSLIEIHLDEPIYSAEKVQQLEEVIQNFNQDGYEIIHRTIAFNQKIQGISEMYNPSQNLSELAPTEVFHKLLQTQEMDVETKKEIENAFYIILEEVQQELTD